MSDATEIRPEVLEAIIQDVFSTMVGLKISPARSGYPKPAGNTVTAVVGAIGAAAYVIVLQASEKLACRIAEAMLDEKSAAWSDMAADAFGEVANITAGNFKAYLSEGLKLSVPMVVHGRDYEWRSPHTRLLLEQKFLCDGEGLTVWVSKDESGEKGK